MNCEMAADGPMLNDIMGDHGMLSGSETVKSTGMSDEDQSKFWSQVQKAERGQGQTDQGQGRANRSGRKSPCWNRGRKGEGHDTKRCSKSLQRLALSVSHLQARAWAIRWCTSFPHTAYGWRRPMVSWTIIGSGVTEDSAGFMAWVRQVDCECRASASKASRRPWRKKYLWVETTKWVSLRN